jgi:predicted DNA-binding transcriptional regulator AlpA
VTAAKLGARKATEISNARCEYWWIAWDGKPRPCFLMHLESYLFMMCSNGASRSEEVFVMRKMNSENAPEILTLTEAAGMLRVSQRHLFQILADGNGPPVISLGRRKVIRREALQQWLLNQEAAADAAR